MSRQVHKILILMLGVVMVAVSAAAEDAPLDYIKKCPQVADGRAQVVEFDGKTVSGTPVKLLGLLTKPTGEGPFPGLVILPGSNGLIVPYCYSSIAPTFLEWGFATLTVAPRTARERDGTPRYIYSFADHGNYGFAGARTLGSFDFVDKDRIVLWGHSNGGVAVIDAVNFGGDKLDVYRAAVAAAPYCPGEARPPGIPLLVVTGENDREVQPEFCTAYAKQLEETEGFQFLLLPDTGHSYWAKLADDYNATAHKLAAEQVKAFYFRNLNVPR